MFDVATLAQTQAADFNFVPLLFAAYVIYAIVTSIAKAAKQVQQAGPTQATAAQATVAVPQMTADQVRAALARRRAAIGAANAPASVVRPTIVITPRMAALPDAGTTGPDSFQNITLSATFAQTPPADLSSLLASLPPAAQAIVASAVIGPCASHRGSGHIPEDW